MVEIDGQNTKRLDPLLKIGILIFIIGSGPLLLVVGVSKLGIGDENPNPILLGMMAMFTFWPSILIIIIGLFKTLRNRHRKNSISQQRVSGSAAASPIVLNLAELCHYSDGLTIVSNIVPT